MVQTGEKAEFETSLYHIIFLVSTKGITTVDSSLQHPNKPTVCFAVSIAMTLTTGQRTVLAYSRTFSGSLSVAGSSTILYLLFLRKDRTTYHRLLLGMSFLDVLSSFWAALSTLPVPAYTGVIGGHGTMGTCTAQGYFVQLSVGVPLYTAMLSVFFMLKVRYNVSDQIMARRLEPISMTTIIQFS